MKTMSLPAVLIAGLATLTFPAQATGDLFGLPFNDMASLVLQAAGCRMPDQVTDGLTKCAFVDHNGMPDTTEVNIWDAQPAGHRGDKITKPTPPYLCYAWHDYVGNPFTPDHADRTSSQEVLGRVTHAAGIMHGDALFKAFVYRAKPDEDKITHLKVEGLEVFVEVQRGISQTAHRVFIGPPGFELPDGGL